MLVKILYLKELLNMAAAKKVSNNTQKTQDRQISSEKVLFLNMYYSFADIFKN